MRIDDYEFGRIRIDGVEYSQDVIILRGQVRSPWWRDAGGHVFAPEDLGEVIAAAPEVVLLGTGDSGRAEVLAETHEAFHKAGTRVIVDHTGRLVDEFNRLATGGRDVAAALHLTC
jgi:hypothetical protein